MHPRNKKFPRDCLGRDEKVLLKGCSKKRKTFSDF